MTLPIFPVPPGRSWPINRSISFNTTVQESVTGKRTPVRNQVEPRWVYELDMEFLRDATIASSEFSNHVNTFLISYGRYGTFLYDDLSDDTATDNLFGTGDGVTTTFFLTRSRYGFVQRIAGAALNGSPVLKDNGVTAVGWSIDANGVVTYSVAPGNGHSLTWTGAYYWVCRFDDDTLPLANFMKGHWTGRVKFSTEIITG